MKAAVTDGEEAVRSRRRRGLSRRRPPLTWGADREQAQLITSSSGCWPRRSSASRCMAIPASPLHKKPTLGLDLQGGLEVTLQAVPPPNRELTKEDLDRSVEIMRNRVDKLGVTEPEIRTQGADQIVIQLPGVKDPEAAAEIIGTTAQLELFDLETSLVGPVDLASAASPSRARRCTRLLAQVQAQVKDGDVRARTTSSTRRRSASSPARTAPRRRRSRSPAASCRPAARSSPCPRAWSSSPAARARSSAPARAARASHPTAPTTTSSSTTRRTSRR